MLHPLLFQSTCSPEEDSEALFDWVYTFYMSENPRPTETQQRYRDVHTLREAKITATPEDLAQSTGGEHVDLQGIHVVQSAPELIELSRKQQERHVLVGGYSEHPDGGDIGFARLLQDVQDFINRFRK